MGIDVDVAPCSSSGVTSLPFAGALPFILYVYLRWNYGQHLVRIFEERPPFVIPRGKPMSGAEDVRLLTSDNLELSGCYLRTPADTRVGVILFGLEFGSNRWSCHAYCEQLLAAGFDVFAFETRGQGESDVQPGYEPLQWVTHYDVQDVQAALAYSKRRPDADRAGIGFLASARAAAGLIAAADDPTSAASPTAFATFLTMVPYAEMDHDLQTSCPSAPPADVAELVLQWAAALRGPGFAPWGRRSRPEKVMPARAARSLIHGGIHLHQTHMAQELFDHAPQPKVSGS